MNKVLLIILDGWGIRKKIKGNAITQAKTPNFNHFWKKYPHLALPASGEAIGLPAGQMGTSEVNHMIIGSGRVYYQDLVRINKAIKDKSFFKNSAFMAAFNHAQKNQSALHLAGLVSPGGVHSHEKHLYALLKLAKKVKLKKVFVHVFTDGRDTLPKSAINYVANLEKIIKRLDIGKIATIAGRYWAMDRDHNWERTDKAFNILTEGKGEKFSSSQKAIKTSYNKGKNDEFIVPCLIDEEGLVKANDSLIFINFRNDRMRQITERFLEKGPQNLYLVTMTQYSPDYKVQVAFPQAEIKNILGEVISKAGIKQLRVTETEKFAHLTLFMNCKQELAFEGEDRIMLDSYSDIATHDKRPQMRTPDIAKEIIQDIQGDIHQVIFTNLCNGDMVGHTGNLKATIVGIETIDKALAEIISEGLKYDFNILITGDHGNAEEMIGTGKGAEMLTSHTLNPVPFILISKKYKKYNHQKAGLQDIAPTIIKILGLKQPLEMTGKSLV